MDNPIAVISNPGRSVILAIACCIALPHAQGAPHAGSLAHQEEARRSAAVEEARILLEKGDESYQQARYADAIAAYAGARDLIPDAPLTAELRAAATERYAQASIEQARVLARQGDVPAAKATVDKVLDPNVAPTHPGALDFRNKLDDPIRTNPALTAEHARNVDEVRRTLYTAEGAYNLGKFDEADERYKDVLRIDPTNSAARRGMERVAAAKSAYSASAHDHTRAEMLAQVDAGWETAVPPTEEQLGLADRIGGGISENLLVSGKLNQIVIPRIALEQATLEEAIDFLRVQSIEHDTLEIDPARKGVNIAINYAGADPKTVELIRNQRFNLRLSNVPLSQVLKYVTEITRTAYRVDEFSVIITPAGFTSDELILRSYRVPPDFLTTISTGAAAENFTDDPFGDTGNTGGGLLTTRLSAQEALTKQGVAFPEGAFANYNATTNTLRVNNTATNHDFISQVIETLSQTEPCQVVVRVTMLRTEQRNLEELGFDWLINPFSLNSGNTLFGSGGTVGSTAGRTAADFSDTIGTLPPNSTSTVGSGVITNGLRSGDQALDGNSIDNLIRNPNRSAQNTSVAPGIFSITGLFTDGEAQLIMRGLSQKTGIDVMAQPSTVTRSGQASTVTIIREFIYPTEYEPPEIPTSTGVGDSISPVTPATPTAFEKRDVGMILEVLPVADADRRFIDITLNPSFVEFDGFVNYGTPIRSTASDALGIRTSAINLTDNQILMPVFSTNRTTTQLTVADGSTIVIGGLLNESVQNVEDKVPVLGDIPLLGRMFRSTSRQPTKSAIVFMVQVELQDPTGRPFRDR